MKLDALNDWKNMERFKKLSRLKLIVREALVLIIELESSADSGVLVGPSGFTLTNKGSSNLVNFPQLMVLQSGEASDDIEDEVRALGKESGGQ